MSARCLFLRSIKGITSDMQLATTRHPTVHRTVGFDLSSLLRFMKAHAIPEWGSHELGDPAETRTTDPLLKRLIENLILLGFRNI